MGHVRVTLARPRTLSLFCARKLAVFALRVAVKLQRRGFVRLAITFLQRAVDSVPDILALRLSLARAALSISDDELAVEAILPNIVDRITGVHLYYCRLAAVYLLLERLEQAEQYLKLAKSQFPESSHVWSVSGELMRANGVTDAAVSDFLRSAELTCIRRRKVEALHNAAKVLAEAGRREVEQLYHMILGIDPKDTLAYFGIVDSRKEVAADDPIVSRMRELIIDPLVPDERKAHLHFALGTIHDGQGDCGAAFAHWLIANGLRKRESKRPNLEFMNSSAIDVRRTIFTRSTIDSLSRFGCHDEFLVCIVGLPRSGTTLLEQILGSCADVCALGERTDFQRLARNLPVLMNSSEQYPKCCLALTPKEIYRVAESVRSRMRRMAGPKQWIITKLPEDFLELGLIRILFPNVKIINCRRNVIDVGLSCFMQNFTYVRYANDVEEIAKVIVAYKRMMEHWRSVFPKTTLTEVDYEGLVVDPESIIRYLCDFIGLPFHRSCLDVQRRNRQVQSRSRWQIRQPIYRSSVDRSEKYREYLWRLVSLVDACDSR